LVAAVLAIAVSAVIGTIRIAAAAEATITNRGRAIIINGDIDAPITVRFTQNLAELDRRGVTLSIIHLTSHGGEVPAALDIGRMIRNRWLMTVTRDICNSACFFIWAAGTKRSAFSGTLGLHRSFYDWNSLRKFEEESIGSDYERTVRRNKAFLEQMNVPDRYFDIIMRTSSRRQYYLTPKEIDDLRFTPLVEELILHKCGWLPGSDCAEQAIVYMHGGADQNLAAIGLVPSSNPVEAGIIARPEKTLPKPRPKAIEVLMLKGSNIKDDPASDILVIQEPAERWRKQIYDCIPEGLKGLNQEDAFMPAISPSIKMKLDLAEPK
jgi:hypothetical protein